MPLTTTELRAVINDDNRFLDLVQDGTMKISFSQLGDDISIFALLRATRGAHTHDVFYVDVGAFHPWHYSNTRLLSMLRWRGINIDANELSFQVFQQERPNDINVCCGVAAEEGEMLYHRFAGGPVNTFCEMNAEAWRGGGGLSWCNPCHGQTDQQSSFRIPS